MSMPPADYDGPWKEVLEVYLPEVLAFFFPAACDDIDRAAGYQLLDKELQQVAPDGAGGDQAVDKLVQVTRRDGAQTLVLIHLEVQSQRDATFAERMFRYHARLYDHYRRQIVSLAILGDDRPHWRPGPFGYDLWGCALDLTYPTVKLLDLDRATLEASRNPCAIVVLAHLTAQETRDDPERRAQAKYLLARRLYHLGYTRDEIIRLYRFIDWLLRLPPILEAETWRRIKEFEEEQAMTYISYPERIGRREGSLDGIELALEIKFGAAGTALLPEIQQIEDLERLQAIMERIRVAGSVDDVRAAYAPGS